MTAPRHSGPKPHSLRARIESFFRDNPHEWLTHADIATKFCCSPKSVSSALETIHRYSPHIKLEVVRVVRVKEGP